MHPIKPYFLLLPLLLAATACHHIKDKAKSAVNATGETIGKTGSEFVEGMAEGIDQTMACTVSLSKDLQAAGLSIGKFKIADGDSTTRNILRIYLVFEKELTRNVSIKVFDTKGAEYGRTSTTLSGAPGTAHYFDFSFDKRTEIENKSRFVIE